MFSEHEQLTDANFKGHIGRDGKPTMVGFVAEWCGTCHILEPVLRRVALRYAGSMQTYILDGEKYPATMAAYGIHRLPTLLLFEEGALVDLFVGLISENELTSRLDQLFMGKQRE